MIETWIERYLRAWETNDPDDIRALFTEDATYLTAPYRQPWRGREGIVEGWLGRPDVAGNWTFTWRPIARDGDLHVVQGRTEYRSEAAAYANLWLIRLDGDRCSAFTEWWMLEGG